VLQIQSEDDRGRLTTVTLNPEQGGAVHTYSSHTAAGEVHWFAPASAERPACFPMVPFCSRIKDGIFTYENQRVELIPNNPPEPHAIHGFGFQQPWRIQHQQASRVVLGFEHPADAWPWHHRVTAAYAVRGMCLSVEMTVENLSARAMPLGLGLHPYFPCSRTTELQADCSRWLELDRELLPVALRTLPAGLDVRAGIRPAVAALDHVFTGWQGTARIEWPGVPDADAPQRTLLMRSSCPYLVVWAPPAQDFFCAEGVSNLPDAFNVDVARLLDGRTGYVRLEGRGVHRATWEFVPHLDGIE